MTSVEGTEAPIEDTRRRQLVEVTIDSLAELGYVGTTLAQIAARVVPTYPSSARLSMVDRKSTRLNSSHLGISYAVFCLKKKNQQQILFVQLSFFLIEHKSPVIGLC